MVNSWYKTYTTNITRGEHLWFVAFLFYSQRSPFSLSFTYNGSFACVFLMYPYFQRNHNIIWTTLPRNTILSLLAKPTQKFWSHWIEHLQHGLAPCISIQWNKYNLVQRFPSKLSPFESTSICAASWETHLWVTKLCSITKGKQLCWISWTAHNLLEGYRPSQTGLLYVVSLQDYH